MESRERQGSETWGEQGRSWEQPGQSGRTQQSAQGEAGRVTEIAAARGRQLVESAREGAQQAADYVQGAVEQTREKFNEYRDAGFGKVREDALTYTREQPMNALLIAAGLGLVVGWLTSLGRR
jgi:ElaB/YqjD/DUF883 family membrane-anchored ribosome-binding protein